MWFKRLLRQIVAQEGKEGEIELSVVTDPVIRRLNKRFRRRDRPTDVLSFAYGQEGILGDIIISRESTKRNAQKYGVTYRDEFKRLVIHGALHVLGYNHGRRMSHAEKVYAQL